MGSLDLTTMLRAPSQAITREPTLRPASDLGEVDAQFAGVGTQTLLLNRLECAGGDTQLDEALTFSPPQAALLQVDLLELLGADMGMADGHAVVGALAGELADP